jgi:hypothetical protein
MGLAIKKSEGKVEFLVRGHLEWLIIAVEGKQLTTWNVFKGVHLIVDVPEGPKWGAALCRREREGVGGSGRISSREFRELKSVWCTSDGSWDLIHLASGLLGFCSTTCDLFNKLINKNKKQNKTNTQKKKKKKKKTFCRLLIGSACSGSSSYWGSSS